MKIVREDYLLLANPLTKLWLEAKTCRGDRHEQPQNNLATDGNDHDPELRILCASS